MQPRTLKDQLEAEIADSAAKEAEKPGLHHGRDWWQLSDDEERVFAIDRQRFPRMMTTWHCYEGFKRISVSTIWDDALLDQARRDCPQWCGTAPSEQEFQHFAKEFGGLTYREAAAMYGKNVSWQVRAGVTYYADEPQADSGVF